MNPAVLKEHKNQHKKEKLFSCTQSASKLGNPTDCAKKFANPAELKNMKIRTNMKTYSAALHGTLNPQL